MEYSWNSEPSKKDTDVLVDIIDIMTTPRDFIESWPSVTAWYREFEFTDELSDEERYSEYKYVIEQFRKFVGLRRTELMRMADAGNIDGLKKYVDTSLVDMPEKPSGNENVSIRAKLVFIAMRNAWLKELKRTLEM